MPVDKVQLRLGDSALPKASGAGGSSGTASWGWAVTKACRNLRADLGRADHVPPGGLSADADTTDDLDARADLARYAFGAEFVEVRVHADTGEVRVPRAVGVSPSGGL